MVYAVAATRCQQFDCIPLHPICAIGTLRGEVCHAFPCFSPELMAEDEVAGGDVVDEQEDAAQLDQQVRSDGSTSGTG